MAGQRRGPARVTPARRVAALVVVGAVMVVGVLTTTTGPLYAEVYPTPGQTPEPTGAPPIVKQGSNIFTAEQFVKDYQSALTTAEVETETNPERVFEHARTELTARLVLGFSRGGSGKPKVEVAWDNEAVLRPVEEGTVEVSPVEAVSRSLDECVPRAEGGCEVTWTWTIVPRRVGRQKLLLTVKPIVFVDGQPSEKFKQRNAPIPIDVLVHPVEEEFRVATADLRRMSVSVPDSLTAGSAARVTATLPRTWGEGDDLNADIGLTTGPGSAHATIRPVDTGAATPTTVTRAWSVEPTETGVLTLVFTAAVTGQAGDHPLSDTVPVSRDVEVSGTIWDRIGGLVVWLGGIVTLALGLLALAKYWRDRRGEGDLP